MHGNIGQLPLRAYAYVTKNYDNVILQQDCALIHYANLVRISVDHTFHSAKLRGVDGTNGIKITKLQG